MPKIKNMGTGTARFKEGIYVSGSAHQADGSDSDFSLVVSGSIKIEPGHNAGITFQKEEDELNFIKFANSDDGVSYNAYLAYQVAEHLYLSPGRGADFYLQQRTTISEDPYTFPFRVMDDGTARFEKMQADASASASDIAPDIAFFVSGSDDGANNAVFSGNVVISGSLNAIQKHIQSVKYTNTSDANKNYIRWNTNGANTSISVNNKFICPAPGTLSQIFIRSTATPGSTDIGFHRATDGTENPSTTAIESQTVDISSSNTTKSVQFTPGANFGPGDVISVSVDPTNNHGNMDLTIVLEFDFVI
ncbi:MAG: hypothetical protein CBB97_00520 [Candidatus Endolissoclinum sp. TMED37]|nr:MAG: hypothetical protein CBB97_00520 [Candidatus Endolissoclinum sp. TMED37]